VPPERRDPRAARRPKAEEAAARIVAIKDERDPRAREALQLIEAMFQPQDRQTVEEMLSEVAEDRMGLLAADGFHVLASLDDDGHPEGTTAGFYMHGVNAGFVTYLAVKPEARARKLARTLRRRLVEAFRDDAREGGWDDLAWVIGEVRTRSPWLRRLVRSRGAVPLDLDYFHPGMDPGASADKYVLYLQPVADERRELPVDLVRKILYAVYRHAYRVRYPLVRPGFRAMLEQLEGREVVGERPETEQWRAEG
jgi:GNAT superfamily N-acetyltransferase